MRTNQLIVWLAVICGFGFLSFSVEPDQPPRGDASAPTQVSNVSIFFGTAKVVSLEQLKTNALDTLLQKGHKVPDLAECGITVSVQGAQAGCSVMFFDRGKKWQYLVRYNARGQIAQVWQGEMRHGTVGPNDPKPRVPSGAVKVSPPDSKDQGHKGR